LNTCIIGHVIGRDCCLSLGLIQVQQYKTIQKHVEYDMDKLGFLPRMNFYLRRLCIVCDVRSTNAWAARGLWL